jgi:hypothetical protein
LIFRHVTPVARRADAQLAAPAALAFGGYVLTSDEPAETGRSGRVARVVAEPEMML